MKASYLVIILLLSDITLTSGEDFCAVLMGSSGAVTAAAAVLIIFLYATSDNVLHFDRERLKRDLNENLYGQHIVSDVVLNAVSSFMYNNNPTKPLVLSFHGTTGVGKNHAAKILARNIYAKGDKSSHFITFISEHHFPHKDKVDMYIVQLKQQIHQHISSFPLTMFVFDEMDKMNPRLFEALKPFFDYTPHANGASSSYNHKAIFIFLSNAGGNVIANMALDFWKAGKDREEIQMSSKRMETQILQSIFNDKSNQFWQLVDHFIPFLPLERKHIRQCVLAEMTNLQMSVYNHLDLADTVVSEMPFFPPEEKLFSIKGCKSVRQKLMPYLNKEKEHL